MDIGETLANAREQSNLSVAQVSRQTRIRETVINAIEHDDFSLSGGDFYARGHIRAIARVVGADDGPLIEAYDEAHGGSPLPDSVIQTLEPEPPLRMGERKRPNWSLAMLVALAIIVIFGAVRLIGHHGNDNEAAAKPSASPSQTGHRHKARHAKPSSSPSNSQGPVALGPRQVRVELHADALTWVSVHDSNGSQLFEGMVQADKTKTWTAKKKIDLVLGNAGGVTLTVNGKRLGSPGADGRTMSLSFGPGDPTAA